MALLVILELMQYQKTFENTELFRTSQTGRGHSNQESFNPSPLSILSFGSPRDVGKARIADSNWRALISVYEVNLLRLLGGSSSSHELPLRREAQEDLERSSNTTPRLRNLSPRAISSD
jgi:hypothetical protein